MANYESTYHLSPTAAATVLDVNQDSQMNNSDLQWLLDYLKTGHGSLTAVPEPATFSLGLLGALAVALGGMNSACRKRR